jgi:hypothetical protein
LMLLPPLFMLLLPLLIMLLLPLLVMLLLPLLIMLLLPQFIMLLVPFSTDLHAHCGFDLGFCNKVEDLTALASCTALQYLNLSPCG